MPNDRRRYWRRTLVLTAGLLVAWALVTFVVAYFARDLSFDFFGWPFAFWIAAQGGPAIFVLIIALYARTMDRLDARFDLDEEERD
jgi:putative solute:sodium symporter small subunit